MMLLRRWVERDGAEARVGITQYAADALGDVVFAELPEQGRQVLLLSIFAETTCKVCRPSPMTIFTHVPNNNALLINN